MVEAASAALSEGLSDCSVDNQAEELWASNWQTNWLIIFETAVVHRYPMPNFDQHD